MIDNKKTINFYGSSGGMIQSLRIDSTRRISAKLKADLVEIYAPKANKITVYIESKFGSTVVATDFSIIDGKWTETNRVSWTR